MAHTAFESILEAEIQPVSDLALHQEAWRLAEQLGWARTYDAEYVALARRMGCPLLTVDARLARGAGRVIDILDPSEI